MNGIFLALVLLAFGCAALRQLGIAAADPDTMARLAKATNWREALATQAIDSSEITSSARRNLKETMDILSGAGRDASRLLESAYAELKPAPATGSAHRRSARPRAKPRQAGARRRKPTA